MAALSKILRTAEGGMLHFWCHGCNSIHGIVVIGVKPWKWNNDVNKPTFTPSIKVSGHKLKYGDNGKWIGWERNANGKLIDTCCHSFVKNGRIQFLGDCTHDLKGVTVDLPEWTELDT